jgi:hypothetical protein
MLLFKRYSEMFQKSLPPSKTNAGACCFKLRGLLPGIAVLFLKTP